MTNTAIVFIVIGSLGIASMLIMAYDILIKGEPNEKNEMEKTKNK